MDAVDRVREHLQNSGIPCYKPGIAQGKCAVPYVVARGGGAYALGTSAGGHVGYRVVTLYCFVPRTSGDLAALVARVKAAMRELRGQLKPTGNEGPEMLEDSYDARSQSIEYTALYAELIGG